MKDQYRNKYFLEGLTMGEWWEAVEGERLAVERKGLSCVVKISRDHRLMDLDYSTDNFVCCLTQGRGEVTFVHSLDPVAFSVSKSSMVVLDGDLVVEGHRIRFSHIRTDPPC